MAEVTWPGTVRMSDLAVGASTVTRRVSFFGAVSSANCEKTAVSPVPQPGEK